MSKKKERYYKPSSLTSLVSIPTDGKRQKSHTEALLFVLASLLKNGIRKYNAHHIDDVCKSLEIPLNIGNKFYDIVYKINEQELIFIEIKIVKIKS